MHTQKNNKMKVQNYNHIYCTLYSLAHVIYTIHDPYAYIHSITALKPQILLYFMDKYMYDTTDLMGNG